MDSTAPSAPNAHSWFDDTHALIAGSLFVALVSLCTTLAPRVVRFELLNPWVASVLGAIAIGAILALNHKPGRYLGV